jgi:hypothetical protein
MDRIEKPEYLEEWNRKNDRAFVKDDEEIIVHAEICEGVGSFIIVYRQENTPLEYQTFVADQGIEESIDTAVRNLLS